MSLLIASSSGAGVSQWVPLYSGDIFVIPEFKVDLAARMALIDSAQTTIDIATFELEYSEKAALPLLSKLRDAANRGVKVRVLTTWVGTVARDKLGKVKEYLLDPPTREPILFAEFNGNRRGWLLEDSLHEKLLIVDKKVFLTTGRGHAEEHIRWLDTSFAVQGRLVQLTSDFFDALWRSTTSEVDVEHSIRSSITRAFKKYSWPQNFEFNIPESDRWFAFLNWLSRREDENLLLRNVIIGRARVLHFDMIEQYRNRNLNDHLDKSLESRVKYFNDPILKAVAWKIRRASQVRLSTLSLILHPAMKNAIEASSSNHAQMDFVINGPNATVEMDPINMPFKSELPELQKLVHLPGFHLYGFEPAPNGRKKYNHRKLAVIDDTVFFGSHNFHVQSSTANDEMSFEIESPLFASQMRDLFDADRKKHTRLLTPEEIDLHSKGPDIWRRLLKPFRGFF